MDKRGRREKESNEVVGCGLREKGKERKLGKNEGKGSERGNGRKGKEGEGKAVGKGLRGKDEEEREKG